MLGENKTERNKVKGYLFEIAILKLLEKNGFIIVNLRHESEERIRENKDGFIELKGRGAWHQIDCPCDYDHFIPFTYPIRMLGEVKFFEKPVGKSHIREYIGIIKDIQENYFVSADISDGDMASRRIEIGTYFSANGFNKAAESLAYAHGIRTVSYKNNFAICEIKRIITEIEENYVSVNNVSKGRRKSFLDSFRRQLNQNNIGLSDNYSSEYHHLIHDLSHSLASIRSSFIATTITGVFLHFISYDSFPNELFDGIDEGWCRVYYNVDNLENRYFWIQLFGDEYERKFYFTPPESLDRAAIFGGEGVLDEKERHFGLLSICLRINGIMRNLTLRLDKDWMNDVRNSR